MSQNWDVFNKNVDSKRKYLIYFIFSCISGDPSHIFRECYLSFSQIDRTIKNCFSKNSIPFYVENFEDYFRRFPENSLLCFAEVITNILNWNYSDESFKIVIRAPFVLLGAPLALRISSKVRSKLIYLALFMKEIAKFV